MSTTSTREAPWAAADPNQPDGLYEIVDGVIVEKPVGANEIWLANHLYGFIFLYLRENPLGRVAVEMIFEMDATRRQQRRPDLAFVSYDRYPAGPQDFGTVWKVVPDFVVEVISPNDEYHEVFEKLGEYFAAGVRLVWLVSPRLKQTHSYRSPIDVKILSLGDDLDGEDVLPGFKLALSELFETEI